MLSVPNVISQNLSSNGGTRVGLKYLVLNVVVEINLAQSLHKIP